MAYVPQPVDTGFSFTVEDFVMMGRYAYWSHSGAPDADDYKAVDRAMEITGTARFAKRNQNTLSGGERQKVMLAAAIAQDSEVLILDEPSAFLDPGHRAEIDNILFDINKSGGKTVVFATHDINRAALSSDRIIGLSSGKIVCDGTPREIMQPRVLGDLYGMDFIMIGHPADGMPMTLPSRPEINNGGMR